MTGKDISKAARAILQDIDKNRWRDDTDMPEAISAAMQQLRTDRPDCMIDSSIATVDVADISSLSATIPVDDRFKNALVQYAVYYCVTFHGGEQVNRSRAEVHYAAYQQSIRG